MFLLVMIKNKKVLLHYIILVHNRNINYNKKMFKLMKIFLAKQLIDRLINMYIC